ncbi:Crp/Fnr family transcriptional regulator [Ferrimonas aestuarii]|uniref:Crp/Fnr family transcriptional regulator n=1 Tax=Ferrimonas aestuarii TaxID=2569539 RepID=A0A4U1BXC8_9GAMM|nr:Crp/Fnr family transcriptional regulator [Ferrimonas aestuarii]TKB58385.1 Crp/Fnr family transcriptional regulator [Ferrimonas aestuarii]
MYSKMKLSQFNMIELLKKPKYEGFLSDFCCRQLRRGQLLSQDCHEESKVFVLVSGRLRLYLSYEGREFTLSFLEPGDIFTTHSRMLIEASRESAIMMISVHRFHQEVVSFPEVSMVMTGILGQVLSGTLDVIEGIIFHDVQYRLVEFLLALAQERGTQTSKGLAFECDLNMEEISLLIGTTRQTASSLLNNLIKEGVLERHSRRDFVIPELEKMEALLEQPS